MNTEIALPNSVVQERAAIVDRANTLTVSTAGDAQDAAELLRGIKTVRARISDLLDESIKKAHEAHKVVLDAKRRAESPLAVAEMTIKRKLSDWTTEQERVRRQEEARLRELARREEEEARLREAEALENAGETEQAEQVISAPIVTPIVVLPKAVPPMEGVSTRKTWKFRVVDEKAIPRAYLMVDEKAIRCVVRSLGDKTSIPGVEVYAEDVIAARGF